MSKRLKKLTSSSDWMYYEVDQIPHNCEHRVDRDDLLNIMPGQGLFVNVARFFRRGFLVSHRNRRAIRFFRSHANIDFEQSRHLRLHPFMIHPFSRFRIYWEFLVTIALLVGVLISLYFQAFPFGEADVTLMQEVLRIADIIFLVDILQHFFTGVLKKNTRQVELNFRIVVWQYLRGWFIIDVMGVVPVRSVFVMMMESNRPVSEKQHYARVLHFLSFLKDLCRIARAVPYYRHTSEVFDLNHEVSLYVMLLVGMMYFFHYTACFIYYVSVVCYRLIPEERDASWLALSTVIEHEDPLAMYFITLAHVVSIMLSFCIQVTPRSSVDQLFVVCLLWISQIFFLVIVGKNLQMARARNASSTRYEAMITQVGQFMSSRKLPRSMQNAVFEFYQFQFQGAYFNEAEIMNSVSTQLRQDYMLYRCRDLVERVAFFADLPTAVLVHIVAVMHIEFYLAKDPIIRLHSTGNQMYFIKSGTVVVHSATGKELCHLEDGNHFGEIALVLQNFRRVASVTTLENCELYVLERDEFHRVMSQYPEYLEKIRITAMKRLERTMQLENSSALDLAAYIKTLTGMHKAIATPRRGSGTRPAPAKKSEPRRKPDSKRIKNPASQSDSTTQINPASQSDPTTQINPASQSDQTNPDSKTESQPKPS